MIPSSDVELLLLNLRSEIVTRFCFVLQDTRLTMNPLLHALTLLLLLRCGDVKLPPLCQRWSSLSLDELFDTHLVLCLNFERDVAAAWTFHAIRLVYDWASLGRALPLLKEIWFRFVKKNVPLPTAVLAAALEEL